MDDISSKSSKSSNSIYARRPVRQCPPLGWLVPDGGPPASSSVLTFSPQQLERCARPRQLPTSSTRFHIRGGARSSCAGVPRS